MARRIEAADIRPGMLVRFDPKSRVRQGVEVLIAKGFVARIVEVLDMNRHQMVFDATVDGVPETLAVKRTEFVTVEEDPMERITYRPRGKFIPGTSIYTIVEKWEVVGRRVYVTFRDGSVMQSVRTPAELASATDVVRL